MSDDRGHQPDEEVGADVLVEDLLSQLASEARRANAAEAERDSLIGALKAIRGPADNGPWILIYREAGGGYEGLQAIAEAALGEAGAGS